MKVLIASEFRCNIYKGEYYLLPKAYFIYKRYADAFGKVVLCSRFKKVDKLSGGMMKADFIDDVISINSLSAVILHRYDSLIKDKIIDCDLTVIRCPSIIAYAAARVAKKNNKKVLAESMCDGWEPYWYHGVTGKIIAPYMHFNMKKYVKNADYAIYVTEQYLQNRYPCLNKNINASNVMIEKLDENVLNRRINKIENMDKNNIKIMTTADVDVISKGHRFVISAMKELKEKQINITYYLAGAGDQSIILKQAKKLGVDDSIVFLGRLSMEDVFKYLDFIDIYVHPSLQEGLPRAIIEAMSRACPCIGANTAGIPELLDESCVFNKASSKAIVVSITTILNSDMKKMALNNFNHCSNYLNEKICKKRNGYFEYIKEDLNK